MNVNENIDLNLSVHDDIDRSSSIKLSGIPKAVWSRFVELCAKDLPTEKDKIAWSRVFAGVIGSEFLIRDVIIPYLKSQKKGEYTFLLGGIPLEARDNMDMYCNQANLTSDLLIALMFNSAMTGDLHILNMRPPEEHTGYHVIVNTGITDETWKAWSNLASKLSAIADEHITPEELMGHIFERVLHGNVSVTSNEPDLPDNKVDPPEVGTLEEDVNDLKTRLDKIMESMNEKKTS